MNLSNNKPIMQIQLDQSDSQTTVQDLKEYAATLSNALGFNTSEILKEMTKDDVDQTIHIFNKYFSEYIELLESGNVMVKKK
jgi:basic membrane lipoprotein Med (substrate-binding protein (PBP1-ABC) superfamily)